MELVLTRFAYTPSEVQGVLETPDGEKFWTIERPWVKGDNPGGANFKSCIPDGRYDLIPHARPNGERVVALVNPELGVWYQSEDRPHGVGRYLVLIHVGNYVEDVVGCIAPGLSRACSDNRMMVGSSRAAMNKIKVNDYTSILIKPCEGTV